MTPTLSTIVGLIFAGIAAWSFRVPLIGLVAAGSSGLKSLAGKISAPTPNLIAPAGAGEPTDDELQSYWLALYKRLAKQGCIDGQKALTDLVLPHLTEHPPHSAPEAP